MLALVIYDISEDRAMDIAFAALEDIHPPRGISPIEGRERGYSTFSNSMGSRWFAAVYVFPVHGTGPEGAPTSGYYLAAADDGNSALAEKIGDQLQSALATRLSSVDGTKVASLASSDYASSRREYIRGSSRASPPTPTPAVEKIVVVPSEVKAPSGDSLDLLERLKELSDKGVITKEDYERKKREILDKL